MSKDTEEAGADFVNGTLANTIIERLNKLIEDPEVRNVVSALINVRIDVSAEVADHPTLQVVEDQLGLLGLLNGFVGVMSEGPRAGWGYITAVFDDETQGLLRFERTKNGITA